MARQLRCVTCSLSEACSSLVSPLSEWCSRVTSVMAWASFSRSSSWVSLALDLVLSSSSSKLLFCNLRHTEEHYKREKKRNVWMELWHQGLRTKLQQDRISALARWATATNSPESTQLSFEVLALDISLTQPLQVGSQRALAFGHLLPRKLVFQLQELTNAHTESSFHDQLCHKQEIDYIIGWCMG